MSEISIDDIKERQDTKDDDDFKISSFLDITAYKVGLGSFRSSKHIQLIKDGMVSTGARQSMVKIKNALEKSRRNMAQMDSKNISSFKQLNDSERDIQTYDMKFPSIRKNSQDKVSETNNDSNSNQFLKPSDEKKKGPKASKYLEKNAITIQNNIVKSDLFSDVNYMTPDDIKKYSIALQNKLSKNIYSMISKTKLHNRTGVMQISDLWSGKLTNKISGATKLIKLEKIIQEYKNDIEQFKNTAKFHIPENIIKDLENHLEFILNVLSTRNENKNNLENINQGSLGNFLQKNNENRNIPENVSSNEFSKNSIQHHKAKMYSNSEFESKKSANSHEKNDFYVTNNTFDVLSIRKQSIDDLTNKPQTKNHIIETLRPPSNNQLINVNNKTHSFIKKPDEENIHIDNEKNLDNETNSPNVLSKIRNLKQFKQLASGNFGYTKFSVEANKQAQKKLEDFNIIVKNKKSPNQKPRNQSLDNTQESFYLKQFNYDDFLNEQLLKVSSRFIKVDQNNGPKTPEKEIIHDYKKETALHIKNNESKNSGKGFLRNCSLSVEKIRKNDIRFLNPFEKKTNNRTHRIISNIKKRIDDESRNNSPNIIRTTNNSPNISFLGTISKNVKKKFFEDKQKSHNFHQNVKNSIDLFKRTKMNSILDTTHDSINATKLIQSENKSKNIINESFRKNIDVLKSKKSSIYMLKDQFTSARAYNFKSEHISIVDQIKSNLELKNSEFSSIVSGNNQIYLARNDQNVGREKFNRNTPTFEETKGCLSKKRVGDLIKDCDKFNNNFKSLRNKISEIAGEQENADLRKEKLQKDESDSIKNYLTFKLKKK